MTVSTSPIRLAVIAPLRSMRIGLAAMLSAETDIQVTAQAAGSEELAALAPSWDVILLSGISLVRPDLGQLFQEKQDPPALVVMLDEPLPADLPAWFRLRPFSAIPADSGAPELSLAIRAAAAGFWLVDPALAPGLFQPSAGNLFPGQDGLVEPLTAREIEVLQQLSQGMANKQIAASLHLSENTIKFHISAIYAKLGAGNRAEAVRLAARLGYITF